MHINVTNGNDEIYPSSDTTLVSQGQQVANISWRALIFASTRQQTSSSSSPYSMPIHNTHDTIKLLATDSHRSNYSTIFGPCQGWLHDRNPEDYLWAVFKMIHFLNYAYYVYRATSFSEEP
jgi:hypothetical protein